MSLAPTGRISQGAAKERFNEIQQELSQLSTAFSNNLLDATKAFKKLLRDRADVEGLPASGAMRMGWERGSRVTSTFGLHCHTLAVRQFMGDSSQPPAW